MLMLPPKIYGVAGHELNIYFDNLITENAVGYDFNVTCSVGKQQSDRWTLTTNYYGAFTVTIAAYKDGEYITSLDSLVSIVPASQGAGQTKKCLFVGDSLTAAGIYTQELLNLFNNDDANITLLGLCGENLNKYEGRPGWTVPMYYVDGYSPFAYANIFNFPQYMVDSGFDGVDVVCFMLGTNDIFDELSDAGVNNIAAQNMVRLENMISSIKAYNPNVKIGLALVIPPSQSQDAFGHDYGCAQTRWRYKRNTILYNQALTQQFKDREGQGIYLVPVNVGLDTVHNMHSEQVAANSRSTEIISRQSNGVHPATPGYNQMADSIYYWLKSTWV